MCSAAYKGAIAWNLCSTLQGVCRQIFGGDLDELCFLYTCIVRQSAEVFVHVGVDVSDPFLEQVELIVEYCTATLFTTQQSHAFRLSSFD